MKLNYPEREKEILEFWKKSNIFKKSLEKPAPRGPFVFFEGPPTANGRPGIHHAESRAFKDCIPRFKTMQGYKVDRKGGWDTHGLPVEIEVEKQLGFTDKNQIEEFGIGPFNEKCKESVWKYKSEWEEFTRRLGFWVDLENAYVTYMPEYVESLWWAIKQIWDKGLLYKDYRVTPHCPRCGTSLSSHELSQGYKKVEDPAVFIKFKVLGKENEYLVAWTTTPWTLPSNVALAVGEDIDYVLVEKDGEKLWMAKVLAGKVVEGVEVLEVKKGMELVGMKYEPLFPYVKDALEKATTPNPSLGRRGDSDSTPPLPRGDKGGLPADQNGWTVVAADFVSTEDGSGIVHTAVMYGADDFTLGNKIGLPKYHLVDLEGKFTQAAGPYAGQFVKDADAAIMEDLRSRGLVLREGTIEHDYPFCWRCKSPVIYYAKDSWYIKMTDLQEKLIAENEKINWEPSHIKEGRFGEWLREVKDWAFSRERYWGTPLPIWECQECNERECIGSYEELRTKALQEVKDDFDPHRPFVDEVEIKCAKCGGTARRVTDVCDVWFDSGCMPYAQWHYPFENADKIDKGEVYPADYISEAIDQTRGWFYTLLAVSTLLGKERPYKNVICLGHVLDAKGKKMSKSIGNVVNPMEMMDKYGADAVRWYMYTLNQPGESKRFDEKAMVDMVRQNFTILQNVVSFYQMYETEESRHQGSIDSDNILDKWVLARLHTLIKEVTVDLESYKITEPTRLIGNFITDLSTWYLRRSRERFKSDNEADKQLALQTLHHCLSEVSKL
ncbi:isoleucine--tRNA ligase, partial [Patescibacteria group bacterium]|nr:isoleucine--tRNA ligase [Patescibacteria group bacterium]